jgi:multiple sugar transport system permease protein
LSFTNKNIFDTNAEFVGWENYLYAIKHDKLFALSIKQSMIFALVSGFFVLVTSLILALLLNSKVKGIGVFRTIYMLPFIIPSFAVGAVYKNLFNPTTGLINQVLSLFGVTNLPLWHISPDSALFTMILISSMGFGVKMLVFLAALQSIPEHLYEAARVEGGWPSNSTLLFPIYMFMTAFNMPFRLGYAAAMAWLFFLIILAFTLIQFFASRFYVEKDITLE